MDVSRGMAFNLPRNPTANKLKVLFEHTYRKIIRDFTIFFFSFFFFRVYFMSNDF